MGSNSLDEIQSAIEIEHAHLHNAQARVTALENDIELMEELLGSPEETAEGSLNNPNI